MADYNNSLLSLLPRLNKALKWGLLSTTLFSITAMASTFNIDDVSLDYEIYGQGQPLLLLHGGGGSKESMQLFIDQFAKHFQVIALDSREQGRSSISSKPLSYQRMTQDTLALLDHLHLNAVNVIGYSDGGIIGLLMAIQQPNRVKKLSAIATNYHWNISAESVNSLQAWRDDMLATPISDWPTDIIELFSQFGKQPADAYHVYKDLFDLWLTQPQMLLTDFQKINAEVLYVVGDSDDITVEHTTDMFRHTPSAQLFVLPATGHNVINEQSKLLNLVLSDFLLE
ncbi:alpha/beta fold hydrolase [Thalassotalea aquiviva]|uniref:alpha/beta fold hydrolase n=1 Tax=Thalassotalea aquiviva TaxID=3242415 RepID=UPI003529FB1A